LHWGAFVSSATVQAWTTPLFANLIPFLRGKTFHF
jgi:hypothetical protein